MVNMSRIFFPCSQPTSMMTPETEQTAMSGTQIQVRNRGPRLTNDAEGIKGQLLPQEVHALLERSLWSLNTNKNY